MGEQIVLYACRKCGNTLEQREPGLWSSFLSSALEKLFGYKPAVDPLTCSRCHSDGSFEKVCSYPVQNYEEFIEKTS